MNFVLRWTIFSETFVIFLGGFHFLLRLKDVFNIHNLKLQRPHKFLEHSKIVDLEHFFQIKST